MKKIFLLILVSILAFSLFGCYENDTEENKDTETEIETESETAEESSCDEPEDLWTDAKPVIYLYPNSTIGVDVKLNYIGALTCTYPEYNDGWSVTATPDGTLYDENGMEYNYLYWEGIDDAEPDFSSGYCVRGEDTAGFLEDILSKLGLTRREANEFIVYWLPLMEPNEYNIISFDTENYIKNAQLVITPEPDSMIRVFMTWKASDKPVEITAPEIEAPTRNGFTVVEWGGKEIEE